MSDDPHRLVYTCRSTFLLCADVEIVAKGLLWCHYLNQRAIGAAVWLNSRSKNIHASSTMVLDSAERNSELVLESTMHRLVGTFKNLAPRLASLAGGFPRQKIRASGAARTRTRSPSGRCAHARRLLDWSIVRSCRY